MYSQVVQKSNKEEVKGSYLVEGYWHVPVPEKKKKKME